MESSDQLIEIVADEAELPFILARHWLLLYPIDPRARLLYELLVMHVNVSRGDNSVSATKDSLAEMMGYKKSDSLDPWLKALYSAGLVTVEKKRTSGGLRDRNTYTVRLRPPRGYQGPLSLGDWYRRNKETAAQPVPPSSGVRRNQTNDVSPGGAVPPANGVRTPVERGPVPPANGVELDALELDVKPSSSSVRSNGAEGTREAPVRDDDDEKPKDLEPPTGPVDDDTRIVETITDEHLGELPVVREDPKPTQATPPKPTQAPSAPVQRVLAALDWGRHPRPTPQQETWLHVPLRQALELGWPEKDLIDYCNKALLKARDFPGKYLINALGPNWLGLPPRKPQPKPHTMSPRAQEPLPELDPEQRKAAFERIKSELRAKGHYRDHVGAVA